MVIAFHPHCGPQFEFRTCNGRTKTHIGPSTLPKLHCRSRKITMCKSCRGLQSPTLTKQQIVTGTIQWRHQISFESKAIHTWKEPTSDSPDISVDLRQAHWIALDSIKLFLWCQSAAVNVCCLVTACIGFAFSSWMCVSFCLALWLSPTFQNPH